MAVRSVSHLCTNNRTDRRLPLAPPFDANTCGIADLLVEFSHVRTEARAVHVLHLAAN